MAFEEILLEHNGVTARVSPERGGIVTALRANGKDILFLDPESFANPAKNVRGGVPILFPFAGKLPDDLFKPAGTRIPQHGFARNRAWAVSERSAERLTMRLAADTAALETYPFPCELEQVCSLLPGGLEILLRVKNTGGAPMPVAPGWHPYFYCDGPRKPLSEITVPGIDPALFDPAREFEYGAGAPAGGTEFSLPGLGRVKLAYSENLRHLHFWALPGCNFLCIEPFTGGLGAVNRPQDRVEIAPGAAEVFWMRIEAAAQDVPQPGRSASII